MKQSDLPWFNNIVGMAENTAKEAQNIIETATTQSGNVLKSIAENPLVQPVTKIFGGDWVKILLGGADVEKIRKKVTELKLKYPLENNREIAHRLIVEKAWLAGQLGLITNIIPPIAAGLLGIELIATARLQGEIAYEIAAVYDLDLHEPARRGEVLAIFGLSLGRNILKTGISFVEVVPGIGAVVGASTSALMLYAIGYTACEFYQRKYQSLSVEKSL